MKILLFEDAFIEIIIIYYYSLLLLLLISPGNKGHDWISKSQFDGNSKCGHQNFRCWFIRQQNIWLIIWLFKLIYIVKYSVNIYLFFVLTSEFKKQR